VLYNATAEELVPPYHGNPLFLRVMDMLYYTTAVARCAPFARAQFPPLYAQQVLEAIQITYENLTQSMFPLSVTILSGGNKYPGKIAWWRAAISRKNSTALAPGGKGPCLWG
jgi:hypothetical protein